MKHCYTTIYIDCSADLINRRAHYFYFQFWWSVPILRTLCIYSLAGLFICGTIVCLQEHMKESGTLQNPIIN